MCNLVSQAPGVSFAYFPPDRRTLEAEKAHMRSLQLFGARWIKPHGGVQVGDGRRIGYQQPAPDHGADSVEPDAELVDSSVNFRNN